MTREIHFLSKTGYLTRFAEVFFVIGCCVFKEFKPEDASGNLHCHHT
jgi:hypothetical protein